MYVTHTVINATSTLLVSLQFFSNLGQNAFESVKSYCLQEQHKVRIRDKTIWTIGKNDSRPNVVSMACGWFACERG